MILPFVIDISLAAYADLIAHAGKNPLKTWIVTGMLQFAMLCLCWHQESIKTAHCSSFWRHWRGLQLIKAQYEAARPCGERTSATWRVCSSQEVGRCPSRTHN